MESVKLKTFYEYLQEGYTVAQLATAVEKNGVCGWDRFGRYGEFKASGQRINGVEDALDALAAYWHYEQNFWRETGGLGDPESISLESHPIDSFNQIDFPFIGIHQFGWLLEDLPKINASEKYPMAPRFNAKHAVTRHTNALLHIIGALLDYIDSDMDTEKETAFVKGLNHKFSDVDGLSESNLFKQFTEARRALDAAHTPPIIDSN